ncbi:hypothetical protein LOK49_LG02G00601 [Camellia lanceoleosa]|uniref:Uncharacterized protein n=1 Tax=Camellia lanceoleosa TaxID=1840588 RepID=A0ACC0IHN7_9ERIC|nr:hypothetical protein LOK49_LG02G00601 [Camellia lanceoleosa]
MSRFIHLEVQYRQIQPLAARRSLKSAMIKSCGTGYVASWLIKKLLENGYRVRTTIRSSKHPDSKKDLSYLTNLPCASEKLQIFNADLDLPESFDEAIQGCIGVFHVAHPVDYGEKEPEEVKVQRAINGTLGILKACLDSKTVKRVIYTSSASTIMFNDKGLDVLNENHWSDIDYIRSVKIFGVSYMISKTLTEKAALEFAEKHGLDLVTVIPTIVNRPFICPRVPSSVNFSMAMIFGKKENCKYLGKIQMVHVDDVASAHIFLFEYPHAKGWYLCSAFDITIDKMFEFLSARYPEYPIPTLDSLKEIEIECFTRSDFSSKKLLDTGFKYKYRLEEIKKDLSYLTNLPGASEKLQIFNADLALLESFDEAIQGCIGVFHVAHPIDFEDKEPEEVKTQRAINATLGILKACLKSNRVKRVVYISTASTIILNGKGLDVLDERHWSDIDFVRSLNCYGASYMISKTLTEKATLEFAEKHGLDLVTVIPIVIGGPFICPLCPVQ